MSSRALLATFFAPLVCISCASAPSVELRSPVNTRCAEAGLAGCDQLAEGVLLYVDGNKAEALPKLKAGAAANSPGRLSRFADLLSTLESDPDAAKYSASILSVVATLKLEASQNAKRGLHAKSHAGPGRTSVPKSRHEHAPVRSVSADTDPFQLRDGLEVSPTTALGWCTQTFGQGSRCATIAQGPLYLTDAVPNGRRCQGQFLAVMSGDALTARFESPLAIHGARIFIPSGSSLIFGQYAEPRRESNHGAEEAEIPGPNAAPLKPSIARAIVDEPLPEWSCLLYWSGFVPYGSRRR